MHPDYISPYVVFALLVAFPIGVLLFKAGPVWWRSIKRFLKLYSYWKSMNRITHLKYGAFRNAFRDWRNGVGFHYLN